MSITDRELIDEARAMYQNPDGLARQLADALEAHQGKRAEEGDIARIRCEVAHMLGDTWMFAKRDALTLLAHIYHLSDLLCDAARSGEYALGHQQARREVVEMLEKQQASWPKGLTREALGDAIAAIRAIPDPGELPPWSALMAEQERLRAVLRWIADVWISDGTKDCDDLRKRVHAVLKGEVQHG